MVVGGRFYFFRVFKLFFKFLRGVVILFFRWRFGRLVESSDTLMVVISVVFGFDGRRGFLGFCLLLLVGTEFSFFDFRGICFRD